MEIWLKGITSPKDVELAIKHRVDGVVISNHGGRQLDGMPATLDVLEECAIISEGKIHLAIDGGIRRGSDMFKALALGAKYCFVGRIAIWGLAVSFLLSYPPSWQVANYQQYKGQEGVELALKILLHEFQITMALAG